MYARVQHDGVWGMDIACMDHVVFLPAKLGWLMPKAHLWA